MLDDELDDATCPSSVGLSIKSSVSNYNASVWRSLSRPMTILATCIGFSTAPLRHPSTPLPLLRTLHSSTLADFSLIRLTPRCFRPNSCITSAGRVACKATLLFFAFFCEVFCRKVQQSLLLYLVSFLDDIRVSLGPLPTASAIQGFEFCTDRCVKLSASSDHDSELVRVHASLLRW